MHQHTPWQEDSCAGELCFSQCYPFLSKIMPKVFSSSTKKLSKFTDPCETQRHSKKTIKDTENPPWRCFGSNISITCRYKPFLVNLFLSLQSKKIQNLIQNDHIEADPHANTPKGLVLFPGFERFEGVAFQYTVPLFGLSLAPHTFTKCIDPMRQMGVCILNYLEEYLVFALSDEFIPVKIHIFNEFSQELVFLSQRITFLVTIIDSTCMRAPVLPEYTLAIQQTFTPRMAMLLKRFQKMLDLMSSTSPALQLGLLYIGVWQHGCHVIKVSLPCSSTLVFWTNLGWYEQGMVVGIVGRWKVIFKDASKTGWV